MTKDKIYAIIFWTSLLVILVWVILKMIGVINSPVWIQLIPYFSAVFAAGAFFQSINSIKLDVSDLKARMGSVELRTHNMEKDIIEVKTNVNHFDSDLHDLKVRIA